MIKVINFDDCVVDAKTFYSKDFIMKRLILLITSMFMCRAFAMEVLNNQFDLWESDGVVSWVFSPEKNAISPSVAYVDSGISSVLRMTDSLPQEQIPKCDNIKIRLKMSNTIPFLGVEYVDKFQILVWTNSAVAPIEITTPFNYYVPNKGEEYTHEFFTNVIGLASSSYVAFGLKVIPYGWSQNTIYVESLDVSFPVSFMPAQPEFKDDTVLPGDETLFVRVKAVKSPADKIEDYSLWAVASIPSRGVYTNEMHLVEGSTDLYECDVLASQNIILDAGEKILVCVFSKYKALFDSATGDLGDDYYYREFSGSDKVKRKT